MSKRRIAIIGAGPIGLEAALEGARRGFDVVVYESGSVGRNLQEFGHIGLFTPFGMNSTPRGRARLAAEGNLVPADDALLTASELVDRYLAPLAALPELRGAIRERSRVSHVGREGIPKTRGIVAVGDESRSKQPFLVRVWDLSNGNSRLERADIVLDASGVGPRNGTGRGGLPAPGEQYLYNRVDCSISGLWRNMEYRGRHVLLVGDGHSAATALLEVERLIGEGVGPERVHWVRRDRGPDGAFAEVADDPLPARRALVTRANAIARTASWLEQHAGAIIEEYVLGREGVQVHLCEASGAPCTFVVDRVLALTGYQPDLALTRELQIHLCYASEAPMKLASAILTAAAASPESAGDCLKQIAHGAETLRNPEPDFYVLGAKSYGRNPVFLLTIGHQQIEDVFTLLGSPETARTAAPSLVS